MDSKKQHFCIAKGDLLKAPDQVIVQQLNCLCVRPHGLSEAIANAYPYANVYGRRRALGSRNLAIDQDRGQVGKIVVSKPSESTAGPIVIGLYAQYDYGKAGAASHRTSLAQDNYELRQEWFRACLAELKTWLLTNNITTVGFPYLIGCGLAGGDWNVYKKMLQEFAQDAPFKVTMYRLN